MKSDEIRLENGSNYPPPSNYRIFLPTTPLEFYSPRQIERTKNQNPRILPTPRI